MLGAAHKPGAMPLRPLSLGDMYDAAFRIIRFNPKATVGSAVLVAAVTMAIPIVVTAILTATVNVTIDETGTPDDSSIVGFAGLVRLAARRHRAVLVRQPVRDRDGRPRGRGRGDRQAAHPR